MYFLIGGVGADKYGHTVDLADPVAHFRARSIERTVLTYKLI